MIIFSAFATTCLIIHVVMFSRRLSRPTVRAGDGAMIIRHAIFLNIVFANCCVN